MVEGSPSKGVWRFHRRLAGRFGAAGGRQQRCGHGPDLHRY